MQMDVRYSTKTLLSTKAVYPFVYFSFPSKSNDQKEKIQKVQYHDKSKC